MMMTGYHWLGLGSMISLALAMVLSVYVMFGKVSKRRVYAISFTVLILMISVSGMCFIIYNEYGRTAPWSLR